MKVAVIKYNAGNIRSVDYALRRLGVEAEITADEAVLRAADKVIFPGVGEAETTMNFLNGGNMGQLIKELRQPVLGICLGMQLMCRHSEEGNVDCLGIFDVDVKRFVSQKHEDKVPHMGWNTITQTNSDLFKGFTKEEFVYFVHSFYGGDIFLHLDHPDAALALFLHRHAVEGIVLRKLFRGIRRVADAVAGVGDGVGLHLHRLHAVDLDSGRHDGVQRRLPLGKIGVFGLGLHFLDIGYEHSPAQGYALGGVAKIR